MVGNDEDWMLKVVILASIPSIYVCFYANWSRWHLDDWFWLLLEVFLDLIFVLLLVYTTVDLNFCLNIWSLTNIHGILGPCPNFSPPNFSNAIKAIMEFQELQMLYGFSPWRDLSISESIITVRIIEHIQNYTLKFGPRSPFYLLDFPLHVLVEIRTIPFGDSKLVSESMSEVYEVCSKRTLIMDWKESFYPVIKDSSHDVGNEHGGFSLQGLSSFSTVGTS